jgi:hypothetical protein
VRFRNHFLYEVCEGPQSSQTQPQAKYTPSYQIRILLRKTRDTDTPTIKRTKNPQTHNHLYKRLIQTTRMTRKTGTRNRALTSTIRQSQTATIQPERKQRKIISHHKTCKLIPHHTLHTTPTSIHTGKLMHRQRRL